MGGGGICRMCVFQGGQKKGEEANMSAGGTWDTHDITRTGVVCFSHPGVWARGALMLFDCQLKPVGPVSASWPRVGAETGVSGTEKSRA